MNSSLFEIIILPRQSMTWAEFVASTPPKSIALDGVVRDMPIIDTATLHFNYDHHKGVMREATMCTAGQIEYAIKGGLMKLLTETPGKIYIYINDTDQDTAFAVWLLVNYKKIEGVSSIPAINRLLALNNRWDITGGAYPMNLDDDIIRTHAWVFEPYADLRKSGALALANESVLRSNLEATLGRIDAYLMGRAGQKELDTRHTILFDSPEFKIVNEIGGNDARYWLYNNGMDAFISVVARKPDGRLVCSIGRRSQYIRFPISKLYADLNGLEGFTSDQGWNGSDIIGGSDRLLGTGLSIEQMRDKVQWRLREDGILLN